MRRLFYAGLAVLLVIVFAAGIWVGIWMNQSSNTDAVPSSQTIGTEFDLVSQAWNIVTDNYVDKAAVQPQRLAYGTIAGMVSSLGDTGHSTFLTPSQLQLERSLERGNFEGVGVEVQQKGNNVVVVAPIEGSPAQKAGIRSGDIILKVDGQPIQNISDAVQRIMGPAGTSVTLTIQNSSGVISDIKLTRAKINVEVVTWIMLPDTKIAHLRLSSFSRGASAELDDALGAIKNAGATGIIFDLRDDPGGLLDECVAVSSRFISKGNVLLEKDARGTITPIPVMQSKAVTDLPTTVLINQGTASAAEITAGALRDAGRAKLVGQTTFGTGTVLSQFSLADGSALLLAIQEWLTPSGKTIWHVGLPPDDEVSLGTDVAPLFPTSEQGLTLDQIKNSGDAQLLRALSLLQ